MYRLNQTIRFSNYLMRIKVKMLIFYMKKLIYCLVIEEESISSSRANQYLVDIPSLNQALLDSLFNPTNVWNYKLIKHFNIIF